MMNCATARWIGHRWAFSAYIPELMLPLGEDPELEHLAPPPPPPPHPPCGDPPARAKTRRTRKKKPEAAPRPSAKLPWPSATPSSSESHFRQSAALVFAFALFSFFLRPSPAICAATERGFVFGGFGTFMAFGTPIGPFMALGAFMAFAAFLGGMGAGCERPRADGAGSGRAVEFAPCKPKWLPTMTLSGVT